MAEFNLADVLRDVSAQDLGQEGREKLVYLDIDQIDDDPKNFYDLSNVEELANNIELIGQQQPARVRVHPDNPERYMIVSGHRRRAARRILVQEGKEQFRLMPCIIEQPAGSEALQELRLIYANSDTRRMTAAEISRQAERVEWLLYKLKEEGTVEFSGRMRDHVAEACKVSKSKLSRLKVIREKLSPVIKPFFDEGKLAESTAYALAQLPKSHQIVIWGSDYNKEGDGSKMPEWTVRSGAKVLESLIPLKCADGSECANFERMVKRSMKVTCYNDCGGCCKDCDRKMECGTVCATVKPEVKAAKAEKKKQEAEAKAAEERQLEEDISSNVEVWKRLSKSADEAGISHDKVAELMSPLHYIRHEYRNILADPEKEKQHIYAAQFDEWDMLRELADLLGVSADYIIGRSATPQPSAATLESTPVWKDPAKGELPADGDAVIVVRSFPGLSLDATDAVFRNGAFTETAYGLKFNDVVLWQPFDVSDYDVPDSGTDEEREDNDD